MAEILAETGCATSAAEGHTYKKLLCAAFDMSVLRSHLGDAAPPFFDRNGTFKSLDDGKKLNLVGVT